MPWQLYILLDLKTASFGIKKRTHFRNISSLWNVMFRIPVMCKVQGLVNPKCNVIRIQNWVLCDSTSTDRNHTLIQVNTQLKFLNTPITQEPWASLISISMKFFKFSVWRILIE